jgi:hypothetical protein
LSTESLADPARRSTREALADAIEGELDRIRHARPHLSSRLDRAAGILVQQLSLPPRRRPIRCRIGQHGGHRRCLVRSSTDSGGVYVVQERDFACSCPDFHRHGPGCKHSLAVYVLSRVPVAQVGHARSRSELASLGCHACNNGWITLGEDLIDSQSGEMVHSENVVRCRRCQPTEPPYMTPAEMEAWMEGTRWRYASSMPQHPHDYSLREWNDPETFSRVCRTIWDKGYDRRYIGRTWRSLDIGPDHYVWLHPEPSAGRAAALERAGIVNRAEHSQVRLI